jgi:hypothetical protein
MEWHMAYKMFVFFLFIFLCLLSGCGKLTNMFESVHVNCISYNGKVEASGNKSGKDDTRNGSLVFMSYSNLFNSTFAYDAQLTGSGIYKNAYLLASQSKGIFLILMPDKLHGIVGIRKDENGNKIYEIQVPVLCFKSY